MVLLIVDTQKGITDERLYKFEELQKNIKLLIETARKNGTEVIYVRHDDGTGSGFSKGDADFEIFEDFSPTDSERIFDKTVNSAFHVSTGLLDYLKSKNEKQVMIAGLQTDYCIDATIKSGFEHGFEMIVPEHANSTFDNMYIPSEISYNYYNKLIWPKRYATCIKMDEAVKLLAK